MSTILTLLLFGLGFAIVLVVAAIVWLVKRGAGKKAVQDIADAAKQDVQNAVNKL